MGWDEIGAIATVVGVVLATLGAIGTVFAFTWRRIDKVEERLRNIEDDKNYLTGVEHSRAQALEKTKEIARRKGR
ncbi:MAG: hypothetical protein V4510_04485 [bacterium]